MDFSNEKVFTGARDIKYLFEPSDSPYLVIVFSGFPKPNSPALYNYVRTLHNIKANKLFILDEYGAENPVGCYYLGEKRDLSVEASVVALITYIARQNRIDFANIIACGSSKGGFASLYFGMKYGFGHVISGGAQVLLGNYLLREISVTRPVAEYIAGGTEQDAVAYLNGLLTDVIATTNAFPDIHVHVGKGEPHYERHTVPLLTMLQERGQKVQLDLADYDSHSQLIEYFPPYLLQTLGELVR